MAAIGRNAPCPCGSGKKYKRCCALKVGQTPLASRIVISMIGVMLLVGAVFMLVSLNREDGDQSARARVWSEEHGHYHYQ
jgi:hypothetical protein